MIHNNCKFYREQLGPALHKADPDLSTHVLSWHGTDTSIQSGVVNLTSFMGPNLPLSEMMWS